MNAGRELDKLVAEHVMNLEDVRHQEQGRRNDLVYGTNVMAGVACLVPFYSTNISAAWQVVATMNSKGFHMKMVQRTHNISSVTVGFLSDCEHEFISDGDTAPHVVCLAALKAIGHGVEKK